MAVLTPDKEDEDLAIALDDIGADRLWLAVRKEPGMEAKGMALVETIEVEPQSFQKIQHDKPSN